MEGGKGEPDGAELALTVTLARVCGTVRYCRSEARGFNVVLRGSPPQLLGGGDEVYVAPATDKS